MPDSKFSIHPSFQGSICLLGCLAWKISIVFPFQWKCWWLITRLFICLQAIWFHLQWWRALFPEGILEHQSSSFTPLMMSRCFPTSVMRNQLSVEQKPFQDNLYFFSLAPSKNFPSHEFNCDVSCMNFFILHWFIGLCKHLAWCILQVGKNTARFF